MAAVDGSAHPRGDGRLGSAQVLQRIATLVLLTVLAAYRGSVVSTALATTALAVAVSHALLWWHFRVHPLPRRSAADYFWCYGAGTSVFALAAGAALAEAVSAAFVPDTANALEVAVLGGLSAVELLQMRQMLQRDAPREVADTWMLSPTVWARYPVAATCLAEQALLITALVVTMLARVLASQFDVRSAEPLGAFVLAVLLAGTAAAFALAMSRLIAGTPVSDGIQRALLVAIDRAAMQSGAVRHVAAVDAMYIGPAAILVTLQLDFKDGVSAQHFAPVIEKLRRAAIAEVPIVTDVVLAPPANFIAAKKVPERC